MAGKVRCISHSLTPSFTTFRAYGRVSRIVAGNSALGQAAAMTGPRPLPLQDLLIEGANQNRYNTTAIVMAIQTSSAKLTTNGRTVPTGATRLLGDKVPGVRQAITV